MIRDVIEFWQFFGPFVAIGFVAIQARRIGRLQRQLDFRSNLEAVLLVANEPEVIGDGLDDPNYRRDVPKEIAHG